MRGCQFGSPLPGLVPTIVCQPGKHFQNTWRSGVVSDSSCCCPPVCFLSSISDTNHQPEEPVINVFNIFLSNVSQGNLFLQEHGFQMQNKWYLDFSLICCHFVYIHLMRLLSVCGFLEMAIPAEQLRSTLS